MNNTNRIEITNNNQNDDQKLIIKPPNATESKISALSVLCRICYDNDKDEPLIAPCHCKGSVAFVHRSCLERWLAESNSTTCELCHQFFKTERTPKYTSKQSIWRWLRFHHIPGDGGRGARGDIIACTIITPLTIIITYVCLFSSDYYNQKKFATIPAARWTSVSLLAMIAVMLMGYYLWVYSVIRLHSRMWYNWWQRECVVRYIPPATTTIFNFPENNQNDTIEVPTNTPNSTISIQIDNNESSIGNLAEEMVMDPVLNSNTSLNSSEDSSGEVVVNPSITINIGNDEEETNGKNCINKETII